jgi:myo-inositol 2-dehydrogenase / D-chiro-inositol 1-dehydrogenase
MMNRIALFGAGFIGSVHARNIAAHPRATLAYVYDVNAAAAEKLANELGARVAESPEQIWSASDVDAVVIASWTTTHAELLLGALAAGLPAYLEKPIDLDIQRVKVVVAAAKSASVPIMMGFSRRFDPNHLGVYEAVRNGTVGKIELMHLTSRGPNPPPISYVKVSGGQFRDQTIHFFDLACWIANADPAEVYATGAALVDPAIGAAGDIDTSMLILKFADGALCHIDNSRRAAYGYDERIEVFGADGLVISERKPTRNVMLYQGTKAVTDGLHAGWYERMEPSFTHAIDAFVCAIEGRDVLYPTLADGLRAQIVAEAAVESLRTNRPVPITYWQPV